MIRVSQAEFEQAVAEALAGIPAQFAPYLENVVIEVRRRPDRRLQKQYDVPPDLLGLYVGQPLQEKGPASGPAPLPDRILIFKDNLCDMCDSRQELIDEIRITILHEVGHHFGLDEDRLEELGYA
jgi:predicted Zn-dependent protease with MMP-like domain